MNRDDKQNDPYEVLIIGGGAAGLAAAMTFGRLRRRVLLCDDQQPRNQPSAHMNNFPGFDGVHPEVWRQQVRTELQKYPSIELRTDRVLQVSPADGGFGVTLTSGRSARVQKVLLAYGVRDHLPAIQNLEALWGDTVAHCPYCHGFEFQDQPLALLGDGEMALHMLAMLLGLSSDLVLLTQGPSQLTQAQKQKISSQKIQIIEAPVEALAHKQSKLTEIVFKNGERLPRSALFLMPKFPFRRSATLGEELGCEVNDFGWYEVDAFGKTSVPGVYAAGDIAGTHGQSVLNSAAFGSTAAARMVAELLMAKAGF